MPETSIVNLRPITDGTTAFAEPLVATLPHQILWKLNGRCDLHCDGCYVYDKPDQTYQDKPSRMSREIEEDAALFASSYAVTNELGRLSLILHGGEALALGPARIRHTSETVRRLMPSNVDLDLIVHTNGLALNNPQMRDALLDGGIQVGVSVDGGREAHDAIRRDLKDRATYDRVATGVDALRQGPYAKLYKGILWTLNLETQPDPVANYEELVGRFEPPVIDLLLPHYTWEDRPPGRDDNRYNTPYGDAVCAIFDRWIQENPSKTRIRLFDSIISMLRGGPSFVETIGLQESAPEFVVETDGTLEAPDWLKAAYHGAAYTGLNVRDNTVEELMQHPKMRALSIGKAALAPNCQVCSVVDTCGGGLPVHRWGNGTFQNPSVYCPDLVKIITHIEGKLKEIDRTSEVWATQNVYRRIAQAPPGYAY